MNVSVKASAGEYVNFLKCSIECEQDKEIFVVGIEIDSVNVWYVCRFDDGATHKLQESDIKEGLDAFAKRDFDILEPLSVINIMAANLKDVLYPRAIINKVFITENGALYSCVVANGAVLDVPETHLKPVGE